MFRVSLKLDTLPEDRQELYRAAWSCGFRRTPRVRHTKHISFIPYSEWKLKPEKMVEVLTNTTVVESWERERPFPCC